MFPDSRCPEGMEPSLRRAESSHGDFTAIQAPDGVPWDTQWEASTVLLQSLP